MYNWHIAGCVSCHGQGSVLSNYYSTGQPAETVINLSQCAITFFIARSHYQITKGSIALRLLDNNSVGWQANATVSWGSICGFIFLFWNCFVFATWLLFLCFAFGITLCNIKFFTACSHLAALFFYFFSLSLSLSVSLWSNREIAIKWGPCLNKVKKQRKEGVILSNVMSHSWPVYCPMKKQPQINSRINRCFPGVEDFVAHLEKIDCSVLWWWAFKLYHTFLATLIS